MSSSQRCDEKSNNSEQIPIKNKIKNNIKEKPEINDNTNENKCPEIKQGSITSTEVTFENSLTEEKKKLLFKNGCCHCCQKEIHYLKIHLIICCTLNIMFLFPFLIALNKSGIKFNTCKAIFNLMNTNNYYNYLYFYCDYINLQKNILIIYLILNFLYLINETIMIFVIKIIYFQKQIIINYL